MLAGKLALRFGERKPVALMRQMSESEFQWWRRFDEACPLDASDDILRALAEMTATLCTVHGAQVSKQTFLPARLREPDA